ncbi:MAG TPA: VOC family protein [Reyranella sp.]|nr:VOC family protein [Reyranella sp.]
MLDRCDRVQIAVHDAAKAASRYKKLLGGEVSRRDHSRYLDARRTILAIGESEFELCEPDGAGRTRKFLDARGEGLMTAGYCTADLDGMAKRWEGLGIAYEREGEQLYLGGDVTFGLPMVISQSTYRPRVGPVSFLYETTNTLASDWRRAAALYAGLFGLDPARFCGIGSDRFGYVGTLTLFDPPNRLDRIELSQATDDVHAMGRFVKKHGDSLYMCYVETHDWPAIRGRLLDANARYTPRGSDPATDPDGGWVHPKELHGLLLGISRTGLAWEWSGREDLVPTL